MVGSLVVVFPTPHSGGELVLRHSEKEWKVDGASLVSSEPSPSITYIAFYSDVEHEVLKVTSGHRVTITYNLYLLPSPIEPRVPSVSISRNTAGLVDFEGSLEVMLRDNTFFPKGATIGFGLRYQYPVTYNTQMEDLKERLKGSDARVWHACSNLGLEPKLRITYGTSGIGTKSNRVRVLTNGYYEPRAGGQYDEGFLYTLMSRDLSHGVNVVNGIDVLKGRIKGFYHDRKKIIQVVWITDLAPVSMLERPVMAYGNEAELEFVYCDPCLLATVKPANERECNTDAAA